MAVAWHHAESSARRFGGKPEDYLAIHEWFDDTKEALPNWRHRAAKHHSCGIEMCEKQFGKVIINSQDKKVPVKLIAHYHIMEDLGWIPSINDWFKNIRYQKWMTKGTQKLDLQS